MTPTACECATHTWQEVTSNWSNKMTLQAYTSITVTTSMTHGPSSDYINHSGTQQILCPLRNSTVHSSKPLNPVLTPQNPLSTFAPHCHKTCFNITFQYMVESPTFQMVVFKDPPTAAHTYVTCPNYNYIHQFAAVIAHGCY